eukprot:Pompholyxophrys_punicea_v1_NODE_729_length_1390_cov_1.934082.p2 type:complete len:110 gc:universal NODE_729_length_1390_cov_1.934082:3-332(+)
MLIFGFLQIINGVPVVIKELKSHQVSIIWAFLNDFDVLAILPTGFGKSICFQMMPFIFDFLIQGDLNFPFKPLMPIHVCLIVSPLISLMIDQVTALLKFGKNCVLVERK